MFTIDLLDKVVKQMEEDKDKDFVPYVLYTGFYGSLMVDFVILNLYFNIIYHKKGKYKATINLKKKEGIYKVNITKNNTFVFCKGTKIINELKTRKELYDIIEQL